jgi:hypothetical protein
MENSKIKVIFKFDKEKDLWNHWHKSNWKPSFGQFKINPKTIEICKGKKFEECKEELANNFRKTYESKMIGLFLESVEKSWREIEEKFFRRMNNLMKNKLNKDIIAYLTTLSICPYDPKEPSFMFSLFYSLPSALETCGHEIMHLYFHEFYWDKIEKEIGEEKTGKLKEALTVLLNLEFKDLWFAEDKGYEEHKELREFLANEWKKEKDFEKLLEKCVEYLK